MASPSTRRDLKALRILINQADLSLALVPDHPSIASSRESLNAALALSKDLANRFADPLKVGAAVMGQKGDRRRRNEDRNTSPVLPPCERTEKAEGPANRNSPFRYNQSLQNEKPGTMAGASR